MAYEDDHDDKEVLAIKQRKLLEMQRIAAARSSLHNISKPIVLYDSNFMQEVSKHPLILVDFWAPWCGPCRMVSPIIEQLASEFAGNVVFGKLNIDENQLIARSFGVQSIPTMMIFKNSKVVDVLVGALPKAQIQMKIKQHLSDLQYSVGNGIYG
ncbi:MAG TPA: thioredoxin [Nitrososphaeraceae archaeon]|nr:thioredoxin [Nitrososphaeraceae archaeon]